MPLDRIIANLRMTFRHIDDFLDAIQRLLMVAGHFVNHKERMIMLDLFISNFEFCGHRLLKLL